MQGRVVGPKIKNEIIRVAKLPGVTLKNMRDQFYRTSSATIQKILRENNIKVIVDPRGRVARQG